MNGSKLNPPAIAALVGFMLIMVVVGLWSQDPIWFQATWNQIRPGALVAARTPKKEDPPGGPVGPPAEPTDPGKSVQPPPVEPPPIDKPPDKPPDKPADKPPDQPPPAGPVITPPDPAPAGELALGIHSNGIASEFREQLAGILRSGAKIRDLEFCGDGMVVLYGDNQHLAYKMSPDLDTQLKGLESQFPKDPVRRFRCVNPDTYIVLFGPNGWRSKGLSSTVLDKFKELNAAKDTFNDIAIFGNDRAVVILGDNGYWTHNVPQAWVDSLKVVNQNKWKITQLMEGAGDDKESAFVVRIGGNGYSFDNAPQSMVSEWKKLTEAKRGLQAVAMKGSSWILIEDR